MAKTTRVTTDISHAVVFGHKFFYDKASGKWMCDIPDANTAQLEFFNSSDAYTVASGSSSKKASTKGAETNGGK